MNQKPEATTSAYYETCQWCDHVGTDVEAYVNRMDADRTVVLCPACAVYQRLGYAAPPTHLQAPARLAHESTQAEYNAKAKRLKALLAEQADWDKREHGSQELVGIDTE